MLQHYVKALADRAVAYLNVDLSVEGHVALRARALPILHQLVRDTAKRVSIILKFR